jgi:hypothetical protein
MYTCTHTYVYIYTYTQIYTHVKKSGQIWWYFVRTRHPEMVNDRVIPMELWRWYRDTYCTRMILYEHTSCIQILCMNYALYDVVHVNMSSNLSIFLPVCLLVCLWIHLSISPSITHGFRHMYISTSKRFFLVITCLGPPWTQVLFGPSVVFVLGGPGAGKGTQCTRIAAGAPRGTQGHPGVPRGIGVHQFERTIIPLKWSLTLVNKSPGLSHGWVSS